LKVFAFCCVVAHFWGLWFVCLSVWGKWFGSRKTMEGSWMDLANSGVGQRWVGVGDGWVMFPWLPTRSLAASILNSGFWLSKSWVRDFDPPNSWIRDLGSPKSWIQDFGGSKSWIRDFGSPKSWIQDFASAKSRIQAFGSPKILYWRYIYRNFSVNS